MPSRQRRTNLERREVKQPTPSPGTGAFFLEHQGEPFCFLFVMPTRYTVAWDGTVDFQNLEGEAIQTLNLSHETHFKDLGDPLLRNETTVTLVCPVSDRSDELTEYDLKDRKGHKEYETALQAPERIVFARYDFFGKASASEHSFLADNPQTRRRRKTELAITLHTARLCPRALLAWIVEHHKSASSLKQNLDLDEAVEALNAAVQVVSPGPSSWGHAPGSGT